MTLSDIASIATVISGVAVLGSLIYLGLQTRQNTKHIKALIWQGAADRGVSMNIALADTELSKAFIAGSGGAPTPDAITQRQFYLQCVALYVQYEDMFSQWEDGLMSPERFARFRGTFVLLLATNPGVRTFMSGRSVLGPLPQTPFHIFLRETVAAAEAHTD